MHLTPRQVQMMVFISECSTPITPAQIHYSTKIPYQTIKQYLLQLFNAGLLKKPISYSYAITSKGKKALNKRQRLIKIMTFLSESPTPVRTSKIHYTTKIPYQTVRKYLLQLFNAGLLKKPIPFSYVLTNKGKKAHNKRFYVLTNKRKKAYNKRLEANKKSV